MQSTDNEQKPEFSGFYFLLELVVLLALGRNGDIDPGGGGGAASWTKPPGSNQGSPTDWLCDCQGDVTELSFPLYVTQNKNSCVL